MFENKKKFALWMYPDTLQKVGEIYRGDNCESKSEFIEKAVNFYIGYLTSEDNKSFLPSIVTSTLKSIVAESDNRTSRILFKIAVHRKNLLSLFLFKYGQLRHVSDLFLIQHAAAPHCPNISL